MSGTESYSKDGEFCEPVVRCDSCQALLLVSSIHEDGACSKCGKTKVGNVRTLTRAELDGPIKEWLADGTIDWKWLEWVGVYEADEEAVQ